VHGFDFYVQVELWIANVLAALKLNEMGSSVQIPVVIRYALDAWLELFGMKGAFVSV